MADLDNPKNGQSRYAVFAVSYDVSVKRCFAQVKRSFPIRLCAVENKKNGGDTREEEVSPPECRKPREEDGFSVTMCRAFARAGRTGWN
ncbi:hypothetical protein [Aliiruegeria lutimaris]|uniref:hypothetical protein n=1 Tax=Aliiruegeria lutimaris TaxID=571298 RepID=UPI001113B923|nr:hypothetical protein [Aliiruegeria lutimaris]